MNIEQQVPLESLTTFGIGGPADYLAIAEGEEDLHEALQWAHDQSLQVTILAGGSNVLIADEGIRGLVIRIRMPFRSFAGDIVTAGAGVDLLELIREASGRDLGGWEKLAGIPGSLGGAVRGNAGAFGTEIKDFAVAVRAFNRETSAFKDFTAAECDFSYRHSFFKDHPEWIILSAQLKLVSTTHTASESAVKETIAERERRHLQNVRAAGSFFMNPVAPLAVQQQFEQEKGAVAREGRVPAGWLIEKVGLKGARMGDAEASMQHPNYLVNRGNASARDVLALAQKIKEAVQEQFGVTLQEEAQILA